MLASLLLSLAPQADIALFILDDVASADLALYGGPTVTPNLERLAAQGVTFTRAYANPTCAPSRRSILTGHWWLTGNGQQCAPAQPNSPVLAETLLPEALPHVSGMIGKWHLGGDPLGGPWEQAPISHGFDAWMAGSASNVDACGGAGYSNWLRVNATARFHASSFSTAYEPLAVRDAFTAGWTLTPSPKLAVVAANLAHTPLHIPPAQLLPPGYVVGPSLRARYEAMIVADDRILGQMLARIDLTRTLVIVVGDNGTPGIVAPNAARAKGTCFERGVRVPLVIAGGPSSNPGRRSDELVHVVDLWRTCVEAGGGTVPTGSPHPLVSRSLLPILTDQPHAPLHDFVLVGSRWGDTDGDIASISQAGLKLRQRDVDGDGIVDAEALYDLVMDPGETTNLVGAAAYQADLALHRAFLQAAIP